MGVDIPVIWFAIIVFATLMYIIMDGFDLGIGMLFSFVGDAKERDVMVNSVAPVWDGNETWLVLGGAGLFGAFPLAYAVIIDALTIPLTAMLIGLIFRGVAFEFRFKATPSHRKFWDYSFAGGSLLATFSQGIVVGAMINGFDVEYTAQSNAIIIAQYDRKGVISHVTGALAEHDINIGVMRLSRRARGDIACTIIEVDAHISPNIVAELRALPDIISVRAINVQ